MTEPSSDYSGLLASTWDLWRADTANWSDRNCYLDLVRRFGEPVLDIGCGTGRIVLDYRQLGIDVEGLDSSPEMLAICRAKAAGSGLSVTLHRQDMRALDLPRRYRTILGTSSALQLVPDLDDARRTLRRWVAHLEPAGAVVTPFSFDWREGEPLDTGWELLFELVRPEDGATVRHWTRERRDPALRQWHTDSRFEVELDGRVVATESHRRSPEGRWYTQSEARSLFLDAGLTAVQLLRGFEAAPASADDRLFTVVGVKG
jgi:ubiquinone/menaquinone biosynthesis C-methylase UbiE